MKVLKVIHGFPPDYMAGSEVYSYHLVKALAELVKNITVFTSMENEFDPEYQIYNETYDGIQVQRINKFRRDYSYQEKFYDEYVETAFRNCLECVTPDIVHFGHLSHLSTGLLKIASQEYQLPIVYTIHDFWLFCVKGQLINQHGERCNGSSPEKCHLCSPYHTTVTQVQQTLDYMRHLIDLVDIYLAPSHTVRDFFIQQGRFGRKNTLLKIWI
jgi:glycosyltransferase involved in cell wall biosynthesis